MTIAAENRPRVRAWVGRAVAWWIGELAAIYGDIATASGLGRGGALTVEAGERYWVLRHRHRVIGQVDRQSGDADLLPPALRGRPVTVIIPPERVLSRTIAFPTGARAELGRIVEFEIGRHFPFPAARMFYRHRVVGRPLSVEIVAVPRDTVAAILAELARSGMRVAGIALMARGDAPPLPLPGAALGLGRAAREVSPVLAAGAAVLAVAALAAWPLAQQWRIAALDREIAALKPAGEAAAHRRSRAQAEAGRIAALVKLRTERPPLVALLDLLTREVPDGSYLLSLSIAGRELTIDGLSPSAAAIAQALQKSRAVTEVEFRAPITREGSGLEHFRLGATLAEAAR